MHSMNSVWVGKDKGPFLRASRDIEYVKQHGRRTSTALFNLLVCRTEAAESRVGIIVGRRFGTAVRRNRAKRRFRELIRMARPCLRPGYGILVFPKREAIVLPFDSVKEAWTNALVRRGAIRVEEV